MSSFGHNVLNECHTNFNVHDVISFLVGHIVVIWLQATDYKSQSLRIPSMDIIQAQKGLGEKELHC